MGRAVQFQQELIRDRSHGAEFRLLGDLVEVQDRACSVGVCVIKGFFNRGVLRPGEGEFGLIGKIGKGITGLYLPA